MLEAGSKPTCLRTAVRAVADRERDPAAKRWLLKLLAGDGPAPRPKAKRKRPKAKV